MTKYPPSNCWIPREMRKRGRTPKSQTPGNKKNRDRCQLTSVGGLPRKAYIKGRGYKLRTYSKWISFCNEVNNL